MEPITPGSETPPMQQDGMEEGSPIDDMIAQVDSYIKDPSMVTPETLMQLKNGLMDLKAGIEGDDQPEATPSAPTEGSFSGDIHKRMSGGAY